jgi:hypothetical protein
MKTISLVFGAILSLVLFTGCSNNIKSGDVEPEIIFDNFGVLYLMHSDSVRGANGAQSFYINDIRFAKLKSGEFTWLRLPPGVYTIEQRDSAWTTDLSGRIPRSVFIDVKVLSDKKSYIHYSYPPLELADGSHVSFARVLPWIIGKKRFLELDDKKALEGEKILSYTKPLKVGLFK